MSSDDIKTLNVRQNEMDFYSKSIMSHNVKS